MSVETTPILRNSVGLRLGEMLPGSTDNGGPGVPVTGRPQDCRWPNCSDVDALDARCCGWQGGTAR